jgi:DNA-binding NarL/FixJ family response regulator
VSTPAARILIAEEQALIREAMAAAFEAEVDLTVIAVAGDAAGVLAETLRTAPDLALVGTSLPPGDWPDLCRQLKATAAGPKVVIRQHQADARALLTAVEVGADGYVSGDLQLAKILDAVREVLDGCMYVPPRMLRGLLTDLMQRNRERSEVLRLFLTLTAREREVLALLVAGHGHAGVARILHISPQTARTHIQNIIEKVGVHSRLEVVALTATHHVLDWLQ